MVTQMAPNVLTLHCEEQIMDTWITVALSQPCLHRALVIVGTIVSTS